MDMNAAFLYDKFNMQYEAAQNALKAGNNQSAKRNFLLAAETMFKLAKISDGSLKTSRSERAKRLVEIADRIERGQPIDSHSLNSTSSGASSSSSKGSGQREKDETETLWQAAEIPSIKFEDVAGLDGVKQAIFERIILPKNNPDVYKKFKKKLGGGVLMYGPPGTGKTMIAKAIACEVNAKYYSVKCSDIVSKWFGEAERNIKNLFETARRDPAAVIFFDEFESLGAKRGGSSSVMARIIPELLTQIQGFSESDSTLLLLAATNRPWDIDTAFMRPGRFNELLYIPLPDDEARRYMINRAYEDVPISPLVDIEDIVAATEGYNGADVIEFCEQTKNGPIKRTISNNGSSDEMILPEDIEFAKTKVKSSVAKSDLNQLTKFMKEMNV